METLKSLTILKVSGGREKVRKTTGILILTSFTIRNLKYFLQLNYVVIKEKTPKSVFKIFFLLFFNFIGV